MINMSYAKLNYDPLENFDGYQQLWISAYYIDWYRTENEQNTSQILNIVVCVHDNYVEPP